MLRKRDIKAHEKANQIVQSKRKNKWTNQEEEILVKAIELYGRDWTNVMSLMSESEPSRPYHTIVGHAIKLAKLYQHDPEKALFVEKMSEKFINRGRPQNDSKPSRPDYNWSVASRIVPCDKDDDEIQPVRSSSQENQAQDDQTQESPSPVSTISHQPVSSLNR